jgi:hypothetical protein
LIREIREETEDRITIDLSKVKKVCELTVLEELESGGKKYNGRTLNIYKYNLKKEQLKPYTYFEDSSNYPQYI